MFTLTQNMQVAKDEGHCKAEPSYLTEAEFISSVTAGRDATIKVGVRIADGSTEYSTRVCAPPLTHPLSLR
jgi:hypothetical protein